MPENPYRKGHLYTHLAASAHRDIRALFVGPNVPYGDGTGYCRSCGMNQPRHTSGCRQERARGKG